ncbi:uncharacterized protein LOC125542936 isoform X3 [Triticum urartu]|uniref:uncharacterized protein LOC125542936 isoform X3 n=1 Tax=Triticum urartu TaxID=4572 RepID=UPI002043C5B6|nr:uncharacterized protein LOC125542936 isoform X3 [Triticum urartu]
MPGSSKVPGAVEQGHNPGRERWHQGATIAGTALRVQLPATCTLMMYMDFGLRRTLCRRKMMMMMATDMDTCIHMGCFLRQCRPLIQLMMLKFSMALALHTYGMFPPSMLSSNPVNDAEVFNGFGMQSHPNVENRSLGCNEGVVYEEALQNFYAAYQSRNKGRSVSRI